MPDMSYASDEWRARPLSVVDNLFATRETRADEREDFGVGEFYANVLSTQELYNQVPSLNHEIPDKLGSGTLVRYRGMVADCCDRELFLAHYNRMPHPGADSKVLAHGFFRDGFEMMPGEDFDMNAPGNTYAERSVYYLVPVPGEAPWMYPTTETLPTPTPIQQADNEMNEDRPKRPLDEEDEDTNMDVDLGDVAAAAAALKKTRHTRDGEGAGLNYREAERACVLKVYGKEEGLKLASIVEVVGVLDTSTYFVESDVETASQPPSAAVPRVHCLAMRPVDSLKPTHVPADVTEAVKAQPEELRKRIVALLADCMHGDGLAANYVLLHLLSYIYAPLNGAKVGKLSMNLIGCDKEVVDRLTATLSALVPKHVTIPLSLSNLNAAPFSPSQDENTLRLVPGQLLLTDHTSLLLDEIALQPGQLQATGVTNLQALQRLVTAQTVVYSFPFYQKDFDTDLMVLVCSHAKSMIKCDTSIKIQSVAGYTSGSLLANISQSELAVLRAYIAMARATTFELNEQVQKALTEDYVVMRKENPTAMTSDVLGNMLTLARYLTVSHGKTHLDLDLWAETKRMEAQRNSRA